jgi:ABC-type transport system involved in multi-copper enzyme maturation permease subunit
LAKHRKESVNVLAGPVFTREAIVAPRRVRFYLMRTTYGLTLLLMICTAWMVLTGSQIVRNVSDMASFGANLFRILAPLQMSLIMFLSAVQAASSVAVEKDRKTLILLLMTRLSNSELVLGKLLASLLGVFVMLLTAVPIFMFIVTFGGTSFSQVAWTFAVTAVTAFAAGSLGTTIGLWREKTFQSLALVLLLIVFWIGACEGLALWNRPFAGWSAEQVVAALSPVRAIWAASHPAVDQNWATQVLPYVVTMGLAAFGVAGIGILRVRAWNPSRDIRPGQQEEATNIGLSDAEKEERSDLATARHIDDRSRRVSLRSRNVWANPILWRESCTWAYGRKILFIRGSYWLMAALVFIGVRWLIQDPNTAARTLAAGELSPITQLIAPFFLVSVVIVNALAVTSITNERDGKCLDLLMVTDLSPKEFLFGKLFGVWLISLDMILLPMSLCVYLCWMRFLSVENLAYIVGGMVVLYAFVATLGVHCGMLYWSSRRAIATSLATVFFLFLGVATTMVMLVSFAGNMEAQMAPFLAFNVGGAVGLFAAIRPRHHSPAMILTAGALPFAMYFSVTSLLLNRPLSVFLVMSFVFGFATTSMMVPAMDEFNIALGRSKINEEE